MAVDMDTFFDVMPYVNGNDADALRMYLFQARDVQDTPTKTNAAIKVAIIIASCYGFNDVIKALTPLVGPFNEIDKVNYPFWMRYRSYSPVTAAIAGKRIDTLDVLVKLKYPCRFPNTTRDLIGDLVRNDNVGSLEIILEGGFDLSIPINSSLTPLQVALSSKNEEAALLLLKHGAPYQKHIVQIEWSGMPRVIEWVKDQDLPITKGARQYEERL